MREYIAEFIGTFALVFIGAGAVAAGGSLVAVALAHGLVLMCMVYAVGHISGCHINPAVTIGMWVTKKIDGAKAFGYIVFQIFGGLVAAYFLAVIFANPNYGAISLAEGVSFGQGLLVEAILTFFLVFVIFGVAVDKRSAKGIYGVAIGMVLSFSILMGGALTGASLNPARSFGPALVSGMWMNHLVYWIGPIIGGIIAAILYNGYLMKLDRK
jgi:MIP family channel proteins